jgi:hypothetical protein
VLTPDERPAASGPPGREAYRAMHVASGPDTRHHSARPGRASEASGGGENRVTFNILMLPTNVFCACVRTKTRELLKPPGLLCWGFQ